MGNLPLSKIVFYLTLSFLLGVVVSPFFEGFFFFLLLLLPIFIKDKKLAFLIGLVFTSGIFYYQLQTQDQYIIPLFEEEEVEIEGRVVEEDRNVIQVTDFKSAKVDEKVIIYDSGSLKHGQIVKIIGEPVTPGEKFENYLDKDQISVSFFRPQVEILGRKKNFYSYIYDFRRTLQEKLSAVQYPASSVLKAILLGDKSNVPDILQEKFSQIGVAHLLAVSGTHIVIISGIIVSFLSFLSIKWKLFFALLLLFSFVLLVGAPPSAIRAGFMGAFLIIGKKLGRKGDSLRGLVFIALFMTLLNPKLILKSVSFQLSFLAALGIILFSNKLYRFLTERVVDYKDTLIVTIRQAFATIFNKLPSFVVETISITLSAQVFTLPLVYYYFGSLPLLAPISNLVLSPLLPILMISGIISLCFSFLIPPVFAFSLTYGLVKIVLVFVNLFYEFWLLW
ncbi:MAG: ComEC/Rec2 family competence protein [Patescibacteria group bacterium]